MVEVIIDHPPGRRSSQLSSSSCNSLFRPTSETRRHMKSAPFYNNIVPSGRPAVKDYSPVVKRHLLETVYIFENWVLSNDGFPDKEIYVGERSMEYFW